MYPKIERADIYNLITFVEEYQIISKIEKPISIIIDRNNWGDIVGIEIINLKYHLGQHALDFLLAANLHEAYSYDELSDAFYLKLNTVAHALEQEECSAVAIIDKNGHIIGFKWPN